jgi:hypothetical protein
MEHLHERMMASRDVQKKALILAGLLDAKGRPAIQCETVTPGKSDRNSRSGRNANASPEESSGSEDRMSDSEFANKRRRVEGEHMTGPPEIQNPAKELQSDQNSDSGGVSDSDSDSSVILISDSDSQELGKCAPKKEEQSESDNQRDHHSNDQSNGPSNDKSNAQNNDRGDDERDDQSNDQSDEDQSKDENEDGGFNLTVDNDKPQINGNITPLDTSEGESSSSGARRPRRRQAVLRQKLSRDTLTKLLPPAAASAPSVASATAVLGSSSRSNAPAGQDQAGPQANPQTQLRRGRPRSKGQGAAKQRPKAPARPRGRPKKSEPSGGGMFDFLQNPSLSAFASPTAVSAKADMNQSHSHAMTMRRKRRRRSNGFDSESSSQTSGGGENGARGPTESLDAAGGNTNEIRETGQKNSKSNGSLSGGNAEEKSGKSRSDASGDGSGSNEPDAVAFCQKVMRAFQLGGVSDTARKLGWRTCLAEQFAKDQFPAQDKLLREIERLRGKESKERKREERKALNQERAAKRGAGGGQEMNDDAVAENISKSGSASSSSSSSSNSSSSGSAKPDKSSPAAKLGGEPSKGKITSNLSSNTSTSEEESETESESEPEGVAEDSKQSPIEGDKDSDKIAVEIRPAQKELAVAARTVFYRESLREHQLQLQKNEEDGERIERELQRERIERFKNRGVAGDELRKLSGCGFLSPCEPYLNSLFTDDHAQEVRRLSKKISLTLKKSGSFKCVPDFTGSLGPGEAHLIYFDGWGLRQLRGPGIVCGMPC